MSDSSNNEWAFQEISDAGFDFDKIFGGSSAGTEVNPFAEEAKGEPGKSVESDSVPAPEPAAVPVVKEEPKKEPAAPKTKSAPDNPISAAFEKAETERVQMGLFEKPPVFCYRTAKEPIEDQDMTFEELRIRKCEDFTDLEEGKYVSWSVEYCGIRKDVKDPKGTKIGAMKESIERSKEFMQALKKSKDKNPDCLVKPKIVGKTKGNTSPYKGYFRSVEEAQESDKVICLIPARDGRIYEMNKMEQGVFLAPREKILDFQPIRAGFTPVLPKIPMSLIRQIISFFRSLMQEQGEYEALALIYWSKLAKCYFANVPKQRVWKEQLEADLTDCPYDDDPQYIHYADIHSHNSMEAFFSAKDDKDERGTGLYFVVGELDRFFPDMKARICCGGSFVDIDPAEVIEGFDLEHPDEWHHQVTRADDKSFRKSERCDLGAGEFFKNLLPAKREVFL